MKRNQFTFYKSYRDAGRMMNKKDRLALYEAIIDFALDGYVSGELTQKQEALFMLVVPNLISARRKAMKAYHDTIRLMQGDDYDDDCDDEPTADGCN